MASSEKEKKQTARVEQNQTTGGAKKRRWVRWVVIVLPAMAALVFAAPYLASTSAGKDLVLHFANRQPGQTVAIDELSVNWLGPTSIKGLKVTDGDGGELASVVEVRWSGGALRAIKSWQEFGDIHVQSPEITIRQKENVAEQAEPPSPQPRPAPEEKKSSPLPQLVGAITIDSGVVRIVRPDGRTLELRKLQGKFDLNTLNNISGNVEASVEGGGFVAEFSIQNLAANGSIDPLQATGKCSLKTPAEVPLEKLSGFTLSSGKLTGWGGISVDITFQPKKVDGHFEVALKNFTATDQHQSQPKPMDLTLGGQGTYEPGGITGKVAIKGQPGEITVSMTYKQSDAPVLSAGDIVSAALSEGNVKLPDFTLDAQGNVDLPALAAAVPALLSLRKDIRIDGGKFTIKDIMVRGEENAAATGSVELAGVTGTTADGKKVSLDPVTVAFDTGMEKGKGLQVRKADLKSAFATVSASGNASALDATFNADLARFQQQLGQILDLGKLNLAGTVDGTAKLTRREGQAGDQFDVGILASANNLDYLNENRKLEFKKLTFRAGGNLALKEKKLGKAACDSFQITGDGLNIDCSGWYDSPTGAFYGKVGTVSVDIGKAATWTKALGSDGLDGYTGALTLNATAERAANDKPIVLSGSGNLTRTAYNGEKLVEENINFDWSKMTVAQAGKEITLASAKLAGGPGSFEAKDMDFRFGEKSGFTGHVQVQADIAGAINAAKSVAKWQEPPKLKGRLSWQGDLKQEGDKVSLSSGGKIDDFQIGAGSGTITDKLVEFTQDATIDLKADTLTLRKAQLNSKLLTAHVGGKVEKLKTDKVLDLSGSYSGSWDYLTALIHQFAPATEKNVSLAGDFKSDFTIIGPVGGKDQKTAYEKLNVTGAGVQWSKANVYGLNLGPSALSPTLRDGRLVMQQTAIDANSGKLRVGGTIILSPSNLQIPGKNMVLENVQLTPEFCHELLSRINPTFANLLHVEGVITLATTDINLPLSDLIKKQGSGSGRIDMVKLVIQPAGLLGEIMSLGGPAGSGPQIVKFNGVDFAIKDGRIYYENFTMSFGGVFDLTFRGSVGFDDSLDLHVSIPIKADLLEKLGVKGSARDFARVLDGQRIEIPIKGTRLKPTLALDKVDIRPMIESATKKLLLGQGGETIKGLLPPTAGGKEPTSRPGK